MEVHNSGSHDLLAAEAQILLKLSHHPRLVRYIGMCNEREHPCVITEFAALGALSGVIESISPDMTPAHELAMLQQIASGMEMLAAEGMVHRDLALRNILLFAFDKHNVNITSVKVSDFGLTIHVCGGNTHKTVTSGPKPVRWMAPESLRRDRFSEKSDVW